MLFELIPPGGDWNLAAQRLKYQQAGRVTVAATDRELATVRVRYKRPDGGRSREIAVVMPNDVARKGRNLGFASAVAEAGLLLRGSRYAGKASIAAARARAGRFVGQDRDGYRAEFLRLLETAEALTTLEPTERIEFSARR